MAINIVESNETGEQVATYVSSRSEDGKGRIDVLVSLTVSLPDMSSLVLEEIDTFSHGAPHYTDLLFQGGTVGKLPGLVPRLVPELTVHFVQ